MGIFYTSMWPGKFEMTSQSRSFDGDDEKSFFKKVGRVASKAGKEVIEKALTLYFCWQDPDTPAKAKMIIVGALAYLLNPLELVADVVPFAGFADDLGVLVTAIGMVTVHIKPEHIAKAKERVEMLFG